MSTKLKTDHRRRELAQIHIAKKDINMDDADYRAKIRAISNGATESAGDLDWQGRKKLIEHLNLCRGGNKLPAARSAPLIPKTPEWNKVWSLWQQLADAKKVKSRSAATLLAFCKNQSKVERVEWMTPKNIYAITEALKSWIARG